MPRVKMTLPTPLQDFAQLSWQSHFVESLPADPMKNGGTRQVRDVCFSETAPTSVQSPRILAWSEALGAELGIARPESPTGEAAQVLGGNRLAPGMRPYSARYGGHQFGNWAGQLGDGRAITLGEAETLQGRMEFQLKGAGPTPYSRRADGRAVLRSSLREFACSEAMHFLGVPTTRALSMVATGEKVVRDLFYDGNPKEEPGAIVCRVSPSFLRFGNFEILTASREPALLKQLADYLVTEHYPELGPPASEVYAKLLDVIAVRTARLMTQWMRVGFVHGVMNTDNLSALGLTLDYGPYGWLEPYEPGWTPNTTDAQGRRYCYGNQPAIALWNLERLCEAFLPLVPEQARLQETLAVYKSEFQSSYAQMLAGKLGLVLENSADLGEDENLIKDLLGLLQETETDYTIFFRELCDWKTSGQANVGRGGSASQDNAGDLFLQAISSAFYDLTALTGELRETWILWSQRYTARLKGQPLSDEARASGMKKLNPKYVLRNYLAQNAIIAAEKGDMSVLERLMRVLRHPYDEQPAEEDLAQKRPEWARNKPGCSALSCSS